jgi:hypothetical protein
VVTGLEIMGLRVTAQEREDYMHLWRFLGWLMGIDDRFNPCSSFHSARCAIESLTLHLVRPDEESVRLAHHAIDSMQYSPIGWPRSLYCELSRTLMGDALADHLRLPRSTFNHVVLKGVFLAMRTIQLLFPEPWRVRWNVKAIAGALEEAVPGGSVFAYREGREAEPDDAAIVAKTRRRLLCARIRFLSVAALLIAALTVWQLGALGAPLHY